MTSPIQAGASGCRMLGVTMVLCAVMTLACIAGKPAPEQDLLKTTEIYNKLMAQHEFDKAAAFVAPPYRAEFEARARKTHGLKILDHRLVNATHLQAKGEAHLVVEFDYYYTSSPRRQQFTDLQTWLYLLDGGMGVWRLTSPFPAFP